MKSSKLSLILAFLFIFPAPFLKADEKTEEIKSLIKIAEMKLEKLKNEGGESYAAEEIKKINKAIKDAKEAIKNKNDEKALLIISIGMAYFKKIDAKKELMDAEQKLNMTKNKLAREEESEK